MDNNTVLFDNSQKRNSITVMIYMCGSNLESELGTASDDIDEILASDFDNIIIQTGGALKWHREGMKGIQRFCKKGHKTQLICQMPKREFLSAYMFEDFIKYSAKNYPADRYILLLWNHGGGAVQGFGYDENFPMSRLTIDMMDKALSNAGIKFDIIGIDACIMGNIETAFMLGRYADYFVASEETVVTAGWYYTGFLNMLRNDAVSSGEIGKRIILDYMKKSSKQHASPTLAMTNLKYLCKYCYPLFCKFFGYEVQNINTNRCKMIKKLRARCFDIYKTGYGHIDIIDFLKKFTGINPYAAPLIKELKQAIIYRGGERRYCGVSMYYPDKYNDDTEKMIRIYKNMGLGREYIQYISKIFSKKYDTKK